MKNQSNANNDHALNADEFISLLKRRALEDEAGACAMIDSAAPRLSTIIHDQRAFGLLYRALSQTVLSHLFSKADFIPYRFFSSFVAARTWLLDNRYSSEHRLFLFKFYQQHFIQLLRSQPFTIGILSTLLAFLEQVNEAAFIKEIILVMQPKMIDLFKEPSNLRYFLLHGVTSDGFTLLIREMPDSFELLCKIEDPKFFPLIQFEKLSSEQVTKIQMQLIQNLIFYHDQQKGCPAFFTPTHHAPDNHFISEIKNRMHQPEKNDADKIIELQAIIHEQHASLSTHIKKLLNDRQFTADASVTLTYGQKSSSSFLRSPFSAR